MVRSNIIETSAETNVPATAPTKTKKSKKVVSSDEVVETTPVVVEASVDSEVASAPTPAPKASKKKSKAVVVSDVPSEVASSVVENVVVVPSEDVVVPEVVDETGETGIIDLFSQFSLKLTTIHSSFTALKNDLRVLEKRCNKDMKTMLKKSSKKKRNPNRAPSGFVKPALISEELATFLGKPLGTEMARTSVTKEINQYIKEKSLGDKSNGRHIIPDEALSTLLKLKPEDELTYFNLQRFMSHHFTKSDSSKAVDASKQSAEPVTV